jgi:hypothetical protein
VVHAEGFTAKETLLFRRSETHLLSHFVKKGIRLQPNRTLQDPSRPEMAEGEAQHACQRLRVVFCPTYIDDVAKGLPPYGVAEDFQH